MPRFYRFAADAPQYNAIARTYGTGARAAETRAMGALPRAVGDRYLGPVPSSDRGPVLQGAGYGSLGKLGGRPSFFGHQHLNGVGASNFGGQNKDLGAALLSDNEKRLVMIGVIGLVGWFVFGDKIKKALK